MYQVLHENSCSVVALTTFIHSVVYCLSFTIICSTGPLKITPPDDKIGQPCRQNNNSKAANDRAHNDEDVFVSCFILPGCLLFLNPFGNIPHQGLFDSVVLVVWGGRQVDVASRDGKRNMGRPVIVNTKNSFILPSYHLQKSMFLM